MQMLHRFVLFLMFILNSPLLLLIAAQVPSGSSSAGGTALGDTMPTELMNPVYRQQLRQRLESLRRKQPAYRQSPPIDVSPPAAASPPLSLNTQMHHHRNCFFSPIQCHLPVMMARSTKRKATGTWGHQMVRRLLILRADEGQKRRRK